MVAREPGCGSPDLALPQVSHCCLSVGLGLTWLSILNKIAGHLPTVQNNGALSESRPPVCCTSLTLVESAGVTEGFQMKI